MTTTATITESLETLFTIPLPFVCFENISLVESIIYWKMK